jgi:hypothetical protein
MMQNSGLKTQNTMLQPDFRHLFLAIESDATRYHGSNAQRPRLLDQNQAQQMLAHLTTDLCNLLPGFAHCDLVTAGALFDQTQVLRPGYPLLAAMEKELTANGSSGNAARLSLGAENGCIGPRALMPEDDIPLGILQLLPVVVRAEPGMLAELGAEMEHRFMEEGQVSAHTARWLEPAFAIKINHARFMTLMDLNAMFRLQLEHFGFLPLWQLVDAALNQLDEFEVKLDGGQVFRWHDGVVHMEFQTFDYWSSRGSGQKMESYRGKLAGGYADWTRLMRQYLAMLTAHRIKVEIALPGPGAALPDSFFVETSTAKPRPRCAEVTEHSFAELGTVCISVLSNGTQRNYYPLRPQGLNDIQDAIRQLGLGGRTIAYPGSILFDESKRHLVAEQLSGRQHH